MKSPRLLRASTEITRELLQAPPLADLPGWEVRLFLITYPPGADANNHSHPVVRVGFVLEGSRVSVFDEDPEETFVAGQSFVDPAITASYATAVPPSP